MNSLWYFAAATLVAAGLIGSVLPAVPGLPILFVGIWLAAAIDSFRHVGIGWLVAIAAVGAVGLGLDLVAAALGAKRVGASPRAVWGALIGTVFGMFLGMPGLILGPFAGAVVGEMSAGKSVLRSAHVGVNTWIGLLLGTLVKLVASLSMLALFGAAWWWNRAS